jgi:hypothetical protein
VVLIGACYLCRLDVDGDGPMLEYAMFSSGGVVVGIGHKLISRWIRTWSVRVLDYAPAYNEVMNSIATLIKTAINFQLIIIAWYVSVVKTSTPSVHETRRNFVQIRTYLDTI